MLLGWQTPFPRSVLFGGRQHSSTLVLHVPALQLTKPGSLTGPSGAASPTAPSPSVPASMTAEASVLVSTLASPASLPSVLPERSSSERNAVHAMSPPLAN